MKKKHQKTTLKNGLRLITVPVKNTKAVTVLILVGTGSKYETKEINGISHFLEHMFFKGTSKRPDTLNIAETLDKIGGTYNAFTSKEITGFWAKAEARHLNLLLDWISDIFLNSKIKEKEISREKGVILEEINMYLDTPISYVEDLWEKLLYGNQPAGWSTIGEKKNILSFNRKKIIDYFQNHYSTKNTVICVAGDIKKNNIEEKVGRIFSKANQSPPKNKKEVKEKQLTPQSLIHYKKTDQTHLCLGVRGYSLLSPNKYSQSLLSIILGGNMSSRMFISVRERMGLAYYIHTNSESDSDTGYLVTQAGVDHKNTEKTIKLILKEYRKIKSERVKEKELQKAKDYLKGRMALSLESSDNQASFYAGQEILKRETLTPEEKISKIDEVSVDDIKKLAEDIFKMEKLNLAIIGPFKNKNRFQKILKI